MRLTRQRKGEPAYCAEAASEACLACSAVCCASLFASSSSSFLCSSLRSFSRSLATCAKVQRDPHWVHGCHGYVMSRAVMLSK